MTGWVFENRDILQSLRSRHLTVVLDYYEAMETYSRIGLLRSYRNLQSYFGLLRSYGNLQSYWTTTKIRKLTVVLDYYEAKETYSRIGPLRSYWNLQSYWTTTKLWKLTVVLDYYEAIETYSRIGQLRSYGNMVIPKLSTCDNKNTIYTFSKKHWRLTRSNKNPTKETILQF